jgi:hypothetical protein
MHADTLITGGRVVDGTGNPGATPMSPSSAIA